MLGPFGATVIVLEKSEHGDDSREEALKDCSFAYLLLFALMLNRTSLKDSVVYMFLCAINFFVHLWQILLFICFCLQLNYSSAVITFPLFAASCV